MLNIIALPVVAALLIKLVLLVFARRRGTKSEYLFGLIFAFVFQNIAELSLFVELGLGLDGEALVRFYYVSAAFACLFGALYVFEVARPGAPNKILWYTLAPLCAGLIVLTLSGNFIVAGSESIGYGITAIKGTAYWYFQVLLLSVLGMIVYWLVSG